MNYIETVQWLTQVGLSINECNDDNLKQLFAQRQSEIFTYELNFFEVIMNTIISELLQIDFIKKEKEIYPEPSFISFLDEEIRSHEERINEYSLKVSNLYSKEGIISSYETKKIACQDRIDYSKRVLDENPEDAVSKTSLDSDVLVMRDLDYSLAVLTGNLIASPNKDNQI